MTTEQEYNFQGWVTEIDNARNYRPFRVGMKDATNQYQWFGTFDAKVGQMLEQAGLNSGPWNIQYIMKPWTGQDGTERYNYNIKSISGGQAPQAPEVQQVNEQLYTATPAQPPTPPQGLDPVSGLPNVALPPELQKPEEPVCIHGVKQVAYNAKCGFCIRRDVAFKEVENKDDKTPEQLWHLTNLYDSILAGVEPTPPPNDSFIQQAF